MIQHGADSNVQLEIEKNVIEELSKKWKGLKTGSIEVETENKKIKSDFKLDFYLLGEKENVIGEIYAGIDKLNPGQKKKIITDCFKMVYAEQFLGKPCEKWLVFVDNKIENAFKTESWIAKAIKLFDIKTYVFKLSNDEENKLRKAKELQQHSNQKKQS